MKKTLVLTVICLAAAAGCNSESLETKIVAAPLSTYDTALAPPGAAAELVFQAKDGKTSAKLTVTGLLPGRAYGAHLHVNPCGTDPKAAGGHFQHHPDPVASQSPSVDPAFANAANETWLDFNTDAAGRGSATSSAAWSLSTDPRPRSVVIHADTTKTEAGKAGTAGARIACMTITY